MNDNVQLIPLRVRSHVLRLLGDQLVGHDRLAIFELVKNAYDADATHVEVVVDLRAGKIVVRDNGHGMTTDVVRTKWLDIGTDAKRGSNRVRSPRFLRWPLGEKGVGRLAVQKLGRRLRMVTRAKSSPEVIVHIDWNDLIDSSDYVDGKLQVSVTERESPVVFGGEETGTEIEISALDRKVWARKDLRDLKRLVVSLESPFSSVDSFTVKLVVPGREADIDDVPDLKELLKRSLWTYDFEISKAGFSWAYAFSPPPLKSLKPGKAAQRKPEPLETCAEYRREAKAQATSAADVPLFVDFASALDGIGTIRGRFHVFYRRDEILRLIGDPRQTKQWLRDQAGVRVFRDGIRVYNYGEPDDDWLGLNARRINTPTAKLGTDQVVAAIALDLSESGGLREKTNREGFNQDETFTRFRYVVLSAVEHLEKLHDADRRAIDQAIRGDETQAGSTVSLREAIGGLKAVCDQDKELGRQLNPYVKAIEREVEQVQTVMLNAGMAGMGLALVFHEIDRSVRTLTSQAERGVAAEKLRDGLSDLRKMLDSISVLLRQGKARKISIKELVKKALDLNHARFQFHKLVVSAPIVEGANQDFFVTAPQHLVLSALNNLIDNAIYWAEFRQKQEGTSGGQAALVILTTWSDEDGGTLSVVDNGPGFTISPADALQPFVTKRAGGMGLGLYYCRLVMASIGGSISLGSVDDLREVVAVPEAFTGAAVTLRFKKVEGEQ